MAAPDYSRTKNALIGCLGLTVVAFVGLFVALQRSGRRSSELPCIPSTDALHPLLVGDSSRLALGVIERSSGCGGKTPTGFEWTSSDSSVATIDGDGHVRAIAPGMFTATARRRDITLSADGFVFPPEWTVRIEPDSQTLRVGESYRVSLRAVDKSGALLPNVPFSLFAPEFFDPIAQRKPIVNRASWLNTIEPVLVLAIDTGTTALIGRIGFQQVTTRLRILPRKK